MTLLHQLHVLKKPYLNVQNQQYKFRIENDPLPPVGAVHILRNTEWGGESSRFITILHRGGSPEFITILHRGGS